MSSDQPLRLLVVLGMIRLGEQPEPCALLWGQGWALGPSLPLLGWLSVDRLEIGHDRLALRLKEWR
jgi:hypothetical protein